MKQKVATKFYWFIAISILLTTLFSSVSVVLYLFANFEQEVLKKDELHLKGLSGNVKEFIDKAFLLNYQLANNPILLNNLKEANPDWPVRVSQYEEKYGVFNPLGDNSGLPILQQMHQRYDFVELFFLQDHEGNQTGRSYGKLGRRGKRWWFKKMINDPQHSPFFSDSYYSMTGNKPVSSVFHPITSDGQLLGILGTDINFDYLQNFVSQKLFAKDLYVMITDSNGVIIAHPDRQKLKELYNLKKMTRQVLEMNIADDTVLDEAGHIRTQLVPLDWSDKIPQLLTRALRGESGHVKEVMIEHKPATLYYHPIKLPGEDNRYFNVILVRDKSTLLATKLKIIFFVLLFTMVTLLILLILFNTFFKKCILRPLEILTESIGQADLTHSVSIDLKTNDEFQLLAKSFNHMHQNLRSTGKELLELNEQLEEKVENRTVELKTTNERLNREIKEHQFTEAELKKAKETAESANEAKSLFLANISHELRTPMHGILGFVGLALSKVDRIDREKLKSFLEEINASGQRLLNLLNDLLDLSRLESGKVSYHFSTAAISEPILKAIGALSAFQKEKNIQLVFDPTQAREVAYFDSPKIIQVMQNLISNAIKFSPVGGQVYIQVEKDPEHLQITVKDNGVGVPEIELESIFDKFTQSSKTSNAAGGTGLGLSICRRIVLDHGGEIWANNQPEGGTTITFQLPRQEPTQKKRHGILST